ncbi:RNA-directed DNA polymerase from mobile element jockey-like, partial [Brachionus plicatilis]
MTSDHFPIGACINFDYSVIPKTQPKKLNYKKANWLLFREILRGQNSGLNSASIDELNEEITQKLISAAYKSIPYQTNRIFKTSLPPNIVNKFDEPVSTKEITSAIKRLKEEASSEPDQIHNLMLKNVPQNILKDIIETKIPNAWKSANITMIPKKSNLTQDPAKYRPI